MDVREKLVELLRIHPCNNVDCEKCDEFQDDCWLGKLADKLVCNGVTVQEWKPIGEPPKEKGTYLVCTDNGGVLLGHWYGTAWNAGGGAKKHLAYWMEKPQPPKGE